jgi:DNA-binding SARP family transcriptional activator
VARARAASALWPEQPDEASRSNLRRALWQSPPGWILTMGDEIALDADGDLAEARQLAGHAIAGEPLTLEQIERLSEDILPGWNEEWLAGPQDAFRLLRVQALEAACRSLTASGQLALAIQAGAAALSAEPLSESAAEALILAHLAQRNRYQAVRCFEDFAGRLQRELGVSPHEDLCACVAEVGHGDRASPARAARGSAGQRVDPSDGPVPAPAKSSRSRPAAE